ncbi:MAG: outer membrane lipoprotein chaperone LolA [Ignavibacteria bacterium]|nr:outer membrane lipoprotein chaperone LolA [Ignavibacteria bacterium]
MRKLIFIFLIFPFIAVSAQDAQEIIKKTQDVYKDITDAKATFSSSVKGSGNSSSSSGTLYIAKKDKYRIETKGQTVVTDGVTSWSYSPKKNQVVIDNYKNDKNTFSPNKFLFNYPEEFYSDLDGEEKIGSLDCFVLKLNPRNKGSIKSAKIWIDKNDYLIRKITITSSENTTTYTLNSIDLNPGLNSSKFSFSPPSGVEVIDLR